MFHRRLTLQNEAKDRSFVGNLTGSFGFRRKYVSRDANQVIKIFLILAYFHLQFACGTVSRLKDPLVFEKIVNLSRISQGL